MSTGRMRWVAWGVLLVLAVLLPFFFDSYRVGQFTQAMALAIIFVVLLVRPNGLFGSPEVVRA